MLERGAIRSIMQGAPARIALRWGGGAVLLVAVGFLGHRLIGLGAGELLSKASWPLVAAMSAATLLFAASDALLARAWAILADPAGSIPTRRALGIYGSGVLTKYLPGSVFQYVSRQVGGSRAGIAHTRLAQASVDEIVIHLAASLTVAALMLLAGANPVLASAGSAGLVMALLWAPRAPFRALALQVLAFGGFGAAAAMTGMALFPEGSAFASFAGLFLLAWLAGFLVPIAPGGLGVREATLIVLAASVAGPAEVTVAVLALRISSILGDLVFGLTALARSR